GFALHDMTRVEGVHRMVWSGTVSGPLALTGSIREGLLAALRLNTRLAVVPAAGDNPVHGSIDLAYDHAQRLLSFGPSELDTRFSRIRFSGVLGREMRAAVESTNIDDAQPAIAIFTTGPPPEMPVRLTTGGTAKFDGVVSGPIRSPVIRGHATATHFIVTGREFDRGEADAVVSGSGVTAQNFVLSKGGLRATGSVRLAFLDWKPGPREPISGNFVVHSPNLSDVLAASNLKSPFEVSAGEVTANGKLAGTIGAPEVSGHVDAARVIFAGQPLDRVRSEVRWVGDTLEASGAQLDRGASHLLVNARYDHVAGNWSYGRVRFDAASRGILLGEVRQVTERVPGIEGRIETRIAGEVSLDQAGFRPGAFNGSVSVRGLAVGGEPMGSLQIVASTKGTHAAVNLEGDLAGSKLTGASDWSLEGKYPASGHVDFATLRLSTLLARLSRKPSEAQLPFNGSITGALRFSGNTTEPASWKASLDLPIFEVRPESGFADVPSAPGLVLRNDGPVLVDLDAQGARVRQARFRAKDTNLAVSGRVGFATRNPWDIRIQGGMNLALLRDFEDQIYSAGSMVMDVSVRGALERPDVYGRVDLRNASLNLTGFPNGIDNANGVIFLYRDRAMIETLTAQSGGGKIGVSGFVTFGEAVTFHLQAKATDVRVRYPEGVSSTSNADLTFTGTMERSVLGGEVTITRVGFNPRSDLGTILASAAQPVETPAQPGRFRQGLRFDVRIITAPQVQFETKLTKDVQADANLRLRGNGTHPVVLGRVMVNQGDVMFFGNKYTINSGQILFVNATKIEPTVNMDLETRARGIDVTLHVSGPVNKLNVSYRSDPPLSFSEIVALLTTGHDPGLTTGLSGPQSQIGQNWQQAGASALVTQAIASPIAGRLQRFFGVSRLKIDPQITGLTINNAAARLTLEQNITNKLVFTYITDLSRAQAQTIRIEWDFTRNWSGVAIREENGQFGVDFLYRKQVK
ncbi:MAG TPA: translocation/assembly module TamB domain-containing protein, partial [Bryobacteraceae bacterium]